MGEKGLMVAACFLTTTLSLPGVCRLGHSLSGYGGRYGVAMKRTALAGHSLK